MKATMRMSKHTGTLSMVEVSAEISDIAPPQVRVGKELALTPGEALALAGLLTAAVEEIRMHAALRELLGPTPCDDLGLPDIPLSAPDRP